MSKKFPVLPAHPERICWGCDRYCPSDSLACGNGSERTPHLSELFGEDWMDWGQESSATHPEGTATASEEAPTKARVIPIAEHRSA